MVKISTIFDFIEKSLSVHCQSDAPSKADT